MLQPNIVALVELSHLFVQGMRERKSGNIILVNGESPRSATSDLFGIGNRTNNLYDVFRILKRLTKIAMNQQSFHWKLCKN